MGCENFTYIAHKNDTIMYRNNWQWQLAVGMKREVSTDFSAFKNLPTVFWCKALFVPYKQVPYVPVGLLSL